MHQEKVTKITEYKNRELIKQLEIFLDQAKKGELTGLAFAGKMGEWHHGIGCVGSYENDPVSALGAVGRLFSTINRRAENLGLISEE